MSYTVMPDGTIESVSNVRNEVESEGKKPTIENLQEKIREIWMEFKN